MRFSNIFDIGRLQTAIKSPVIECSDIKQTGYVGSNYSVEELDLRQKELLGCWGTFASFRNETNMGGLLHGDDTLQIGMSARSSSVFMLSFTLARYISYARVPPIAKLKPNNHIDMHSFLYELSKFLLPEGRNYTLSLPFSDPEEAYDLKKILASRRSICLL